MTKRANSRQGRLGLQLLRIAFLALAWTIHPTAMGEEGGGGSFRVATVHQHDAPICDLKAQQLLDAQGLPGWNCDPAFHEQAVRRYDCDGVELDFNRFPRFFKTGTADERVAKMNSLVERVRNLLDVVGWFRMDLRSGWIDRAEVLFIKPK